MASRYAVVANAIALESLPPLTPKATGAFFSNSSRMAGVCSTGEIALHMGALQLSIVQAKPAACSREQHLHPFGGNTECLRNLRVAVPFLEVEKQRATIYRWHQLQCQGNTFTRSVVLRLRIIALRGSLLILQVIQRIPSNKLAAAQDIICHVGRDSIKVRTHVRSVHWNLFQINSSPRTQEGILR